MFLTLKEKRKKNVELKILAAIILLQSFFERTSDFLSLFEEISHKSVKIYYHRLKKVLKQPRKRKRGLVAIDETKIKLETSFDLHYFITFLGLEVDFLIKEGLRIKQLIQATYANDFNEIDRIEIRALLKAKEPLKEHDPE